MKLTYDDKVQIYELRKQGYSLEKLSNKFGINNSNIRYMIKLIDRYGIEFVKKEKNRYYSPELKQEMIDKVLHENWSQDREMCIRDRWESLQFLKRLCRANSSNSWRRFLLVNMLGSLGT